MQITNIALGPRGIHTIAGTKMLGSGEAIEADMTPAEHASAQSTGWFAMPAPAVTEALMVVRETTGASEPEKASPGDGPGRDREAMKRHATGPGPDFFRSFGPEKRKPR